MRPTRWYEHLTLKAWRDLDAERRGLGLVVRARGLDLRLGRRLYRVLWWS